MTFTLRLPHGRILRPFAKYGCADYCNSACPWGGTKGSHARDGSCTLSCILGDRWEMGAASSRVQPLGLAFGCMVFSAAPELFYDIRQGRLHPGLLRPSTSNKLRPMPEPPLRIRDASATRLRCYGIQCAGGQIRFCSSIHVLTAQPPPPPHRCGLHGASP